MVGIRLLGEWWPAKISADTPAARYIPTNHPSLDRQTCALFFSRSSAVHLARNIRRGFFLKQRGATPLVDQAELVIAWGEASSAQGRAV